MGTTVIYPGTFDPITHGHTDIVSRAAAVFRPFDRRRRRQHGQEDGVLDRRAHAPGHRESSTVSTTFDVEHFDGLMVDFARQHGASLILRGLRAVTDFEYEFQLAGMNRKLFPQADTIFFPTSEKYTYISSSLVREIAALGGDISDFVDPMVKQALDERLRKNHSK